MYIIQIRKKALKEIKIIPSPYKQNIIAAIDKLAIIQACSCKN